MPRAQIAPTGVERSFGAEEIIVSKTDTRGRITYANDVFLRVSRYPRQELIGRPHSVLRHPRMPRGVFHLLWQTISSGREIFAYIDNVAADGANYWVLAHVTPSWGPDGRILGYHSNRRLPSPRVVEQVAALYERLLRAEEADSGRPAEVASASAARLVGELAEEGLTYDEYVWRLISGREVCA